MDAPEPGRDRDGADSLTFWKETTPSRKYDRRYELVVDREHVAVLYFTFTIDLWSYSPYPQRDWPEWFDISHEDAHYALTHPETWWMERLL